MVIFCVYLKLLNLNIKIIKIKLVMIDRINSLLNIFDFGDLKFFLLVAKKNIKKSHLFSLQYSHYWFF